MGLPKRKNDIEIYGKRGTMMGKDVVERRQQLLDKITEADSYLPDSILHDDLDMGMLEFVRDNLKIVSDGEEIKIVDKILTIQRWAEFANNWEFSDEDGNVKLPFVAVIRIPDAQPGTHPVVQRTIPDRRTFHYATVPTWNGSQMGADVYKIPQPVAVDIKFDITIVCTKFRDLNKFNKTVLQKFASRQAYTRIKGHYIPIILDSIDDTTPMELLDGRRFYIQNYKFTMLGYLMDSEEFEVKPAVSRFILINEFVKENNYSKKFINKAIEIVIGTFNNIDGLQTSFSVGESIGVLFNVSLNGLLQERGVDYFHVAKTSKITFNHPPPEGSTVVITYYRSKLGEFIDVYGKPIFVGTEYFTYDGSTLVFVTNSIIQSVIGLDINGLLEEEGVGFEITNTNEFTLLHAPVVGSRIGLTYLY